MEKFIGLGISGIFGLIGIILIVITFIIKNSQKKKSKRCTEKTTGIVIEMRYKTSSNTFSSTPTSSWFPVYEYCVDNQKIRKESTFGQSKQIFYDGQKIDIFYNPDNINDFYVPAEKVEKITLILKTIGFIYVVISIIGFGVCIYFYNF